jgi:hypothetical protein
MVDSGVLQKLRILEESGALSPARVAKLVGYDLDALSDIARYYESCSTRAGDDAVKQMAGFAIAYVVDDARKVSRSDGPKCGHRLVGFSVSGPRP